MLEFLLLVLHYWPKKEQFDNNASNDKNDHQKEENVTFRMINVSFPPPHLNVSKINVFFWKSVFYFAGLHSHFFFLSFPLSFSPHFLIPFFSSKQPLLWNSYCVILNCTVKGLFQNSLRFFFLFREKLLIFRSWSEACN